MTDITEMKSHKTADPLVTIVVPIYNTQEYLTPCLDSIRDQHYTNLEILLIDDGSTDDSAKICLKFCEKDSRFRLIRQDNQGLGPARNTGLREAKGRYICFVDSDDYLHPDYVRILYENLINYKADLSICRFETFHGEIPKQDNTAIGEVKNNVRLLDQPGLLKALLKDDSAASATIVVAWNKLVSVNWLKGFSFENKWHEDQFMINEYIKRCKKAVITSAKLYKYRERPDSIMGEEKLKDLRHLDDIEAREIRIRYFYRPKYKPIWKDLFFTGLKYKIIWYRLLYTKENAKLLKKRIYPSYVWELRQYLLAGGLNRKNGYERHMSLYLFLLSPELYLNFMKLYQTLRD